ncbi:hypothetical protein PHSY_006956 [Pseudozyma hubeiensis SY62]|uniref:DNA repair protein n=1 Tax=Pseudozyma hubeiensis (strain SY62) TaxID=1305764 RepID=R9PMP2_PSEHS|nr:hypothetical protein PHSY_006956 [Pseudozyma hubeiensis SY62]GAC99355.1 hypothetical protein PHSY_006956 [Pseudozyma hubeiensis SY62]
MTNSHGYVLEYPRIRVDHFDQAAIPLPASLLAHRRSISNDTVGAAQGPDSLSFAPGQTHFDKPLLYLLTHIHTDHLKGLDRPGIMAPIYCSAATKQLLLRYERQKTRIEKDRDGVHTKHVGVVRPYAHLRVTDDHATARAKLSGYQSTSIDLLHPLPYNVPTKVQYTPTSSVVLTLIESNHMFGGTMFLIQGAQGAVLHTGDMRAEEWWCEALTRNPSLSPYLCWHQDSITASGSEHVEREAWAEQIESLGTTASSSVRGQESLSQSQDDSQSQGVHRSNDLNLEEASNSTAKAPSKHRSQLRLRNIYLDTELLLCNQKVPTKQQACLDMITLMRMYPSNTVFFLNCWTWGYEDMLIVTAKAFGCKIHVDRFKYIMYKAARSEAPFLADIVTQDGSKTRFHACEKRNVCSHVQSLASRYSGNADPAWAREALAAHSQMDSSSPDARQRWGPVRSQPEPLLVYVNPGQIASDKWPGMFEDTKHRLEAAQRHETAWPEALVVPMERHSTLPELQMFVGLFRPKTVSPNTILDPKGGLDYYLLHHLFGHLLAGAEDRRKMADEGLLMLGNKTWSFYETQLARAREQAQTRRNGGVADSTEAIRATSASLNTNGHGESVGESLDAWQLERLSKLRGISFKGLMMQNMAGNLAAMLEIERWRRAAGIEEPLEGLDGVIEESLESTQGKTEASVPSVDYEADHSQMAETQISPSRLRASILHKDEIAEVSFAQDHPVDASDEAMQAEAQSSPAPAQQAVHPSAVPTAAVDSLLDSQQSHPSAADEEEELSTELSEDLASRYLNVLIHHFSVPFQRTDTSYVQMWKAVRRTLADQAQKVEEHWFRETGVLPPLWSSKAVEAERAVHGKMRTTTTLSEDDSQPRAAVVDEVLISFIDMLAPPPAEEGAELLDVPTVYDQSVALQLILRHFVKLGFHNCVAAESSGDGQSHASCGVDTTATDWQSLSSPLTTLTRHLTSNLQILPTSFIDKTELEVTLLSLQLAGILFSTRPLYTIINLDDVQHLLDAVIVIVESASDDVLTLSASRRKTTAFACAVLRAEELDDGVLAPFEQRLLALAQGSDGVLRRMESLMEESAFGESQYAPQHVASGAGQLLRVDQAESPSELVDAGNLDQGEESSMQIRPPRAPTTSITSSQKTSPIPAPPLVETTDSIIADATEHDTIESSTSSAAHPLDASQASSATQEEDETQSEQDESQIASLPIGGRSNRLSNVANRSVGRTTSTPSIVHSRLVAGEERRKRGLASELDDTRSSRRTRK